MQGRPRILESVGRLTATRLLYATPRVTRVLGIESSCDDTGAAVVDDCGNTLGDAIFSQGHIHREYVSSRAIEQSTAIGSNNRTLL